MGKRTAALLTTALLAAVGLAACSPTLKELRVADYDVSLAPDLPTPLPVANINYLPIHVWLYRDGDAIVAVRVTGHATEEVCREVSILLLTTLDKVDQVAGFLSFGVGLLEPARDVAAFQAPARAVRARLEELAKDHPGKVVVHEIAGRTDAVYEHPAADATSADQRIAVLGFAREEDGPFFLPLRRIKGGEAVPLSFEVTIEQLGVDDALLKKLTLSVGLAPWQEQVDHWRMVSEAFAAVDYVRNSRQLFTDRIWRSSEIVLELPKRDAQAYRAVQESSVRLRQMITKIHAIDQLYLIFESLHIPVRGIAVRAGPQRAHGAGLVGQWVPLLKLNDECLERWDDKTYKCRTIVGGIVTPGFVWIEFIKDERAQEDIDSMLDVVDEWSQEEIEAFEEESAKSLAAARADLDDARRLGLDARQARASRERLVDAMLRGWPVPADDLSAERVDRLLRDKIPAVWDGIIAALLEEDHVDLAHDGAVSGLLERGNVFFRVEEIENHRYRVTPYYVVSGVYLEVTDASRGLIYVDTPNVPEVGR